MGWLGIDDTDHINGGCTTHTLYQLISNLPPQFPHQNPRLVRLWPYAAQRTRGNAAVAIEIITDGNEEELIQFLEDWWNDKILPLKDNISTSKDYQRKQYPTDPGMVWFNRQPKAEFYWSAVTKEVTKQQAPKADFSWGGHGIIGASAAVIWPGLNHTFEAISWRTSEAITGRKKREIDMSALAVVDNDPETFMSRDVRSNNILIAPRGNCPVLFGLRAKTMAAAEKNCQLLLDAVNTEQAEGYIVFQTNQATDDHLADNKTDIVTNTSILKRGTVVIETKDNGKLLAFAESGEIKLLSQWLEKGDKIEFNGLKSPDGSIHLEKMRVLIAAPKRKRPLCQDCQVTMKSMGKNQPVRCPKCRRTSQTLWLEIERLPPSKDWLQPPIDARRHLSRPLDWN